MIKYTLAIASKHYEVLAETPREAFKKVVADRPWLSYQDYDVVNTVLDVVAPTSKLKLNRVVEVSV